MSGRIPIVDVQPAVDCGQYPAKAVVGERFVVSATVFREGHDAVNAEVVLTGPDGRTRPRVRLQPGRPGTDRWSAVVSADEVGSWTYHVEAWGDPFATWRHDAGIKVPASLDVELMLEEGARLFEQAAKKVPRQNGRELLLETARSLRDASRPGKARLAAALAPPVTAITDAFPIRDFATSSRKLPLFVQRELALFGSWYEFFPRSEGATSNPSRSGTFRTAEARLPAVAAMGFDVVYLPPIHPIGTTARKGKNNTLDPGPDDVGVPWAIGSPDGGHDAIHPDLGTIEDFDAFVARARELGLEVALDLALQASPDHPWAVEHRDWFSERADGTIAYAENPPKKYQDIYPINFDRDRDGISSEVLRIFRYWIDHGIKVFRVDNPHTKPLSFWYWLIGEIRKTDPDVILLAEAFTKPAMMRQLGKVGFDQSYTYFTWRTGREEIEQYLVELADETSPYMRPNFFVNTPDILHAYLQYGGRPAFKIRAVLAATGSPSWGVYAGYELYEHVAVRPGSEEYLDSEKYQLRPRDWAAYEPGGSKEGQSLAPYIARLNDVRRRHRALQRLRNITIHHTDNDAVTVYSRREPLPDGGEDIVIVAVNLDPHGVQEATVSLDLPGLGLDWQDTIVVHDEITGQTWHWGQRAYVRLDPHHEPCHVLAVRRRGH
ncbi:MAG: alpha-1,4-glucan--maltose-1-phosphate maltosyltransferase [Actinomycetota bacterium]|nr:alpha-1,4-glucan--maltose-1-phosphate maltosyltransferase [Actinomycetota bacterium]